MDIFGDSTLESLSKLLSNDFGNHDSSQNTDYSDLIFEAKGDILPSAEIPSAIYVVSFKKGFRPNAATNLLREKGYKVIELYLLNLKAFPTEKPICFIVDIGDEINSSDVRKSIQLLQKEAIDNDVSVFLMGEPEILDIAESVLSIDVDTVRLERPFDFNEKIRYIDKFLNGEIKSVKRKSILVVDNDVNSSSYLKSILSVKYKVRSVTSPNECIKLLAKNKPDLIITEYKLPVCSGAQLTSMIKSEDEDMPILFYTNVTDTDKMIGLMSLGIDGYLLKSLGAKEIINRVDTVLKKY